MRLVTFSWEGEVTWGVSVGDHVVPASRLSLEDRWPTLLELVRAGEEALDEVRGRLREPVQSLSLAEVRLVSPILDPPRDPVAVGLNYREHTEESAQATGITEGPGAPMLFTKASSSLIGPDQAIRINLGVTKEVDWEVELAVVMGLEGRDTSLDDAMKYVFGYSVANDVSARDVQFRDAVLPQFYQGKRFDTFCPVGPWVVTRDELDASDLTLALRANGVEKQRGTTRQMIFDVPAIVAELSRSRTVQPGELILTGAPSGVGLTPTPPEFLQPGDVVEAEIEGIRVLRNPVVLATDEDGRQP